MSNPDDPAEKEAERVADEVMRMSAERQGSASPNGAEPPVGGDLGDSSSPPAVDPIMDQAPQIDESPQSGRTASDQQVGGDVEKPLESTSGGKPLPPAAQSFFEPRFGRDFGDVRVHTSGEAADLNRKLNAKAFTHGSDIYFGEGQYRPGSSDGRQLMAHELTHVFQQTGENATAATSRVSRKPNSGKEGEGKVAPGASGSAMGLPFLLGGVGSQPGSMGARGGDTGRRYNLTLKVEYPFWFDRRRNNVGWKVVHGDLRYLHNLIEGYKKSYKEQHESLKQQAENQPFVSAVANVFGAAEMPGMHIWSGIPVNLDLVDKQLQTFKDRPDMRPQLKGSIIHNLDVALDDLIAARNKVKKYKKGTIEGAEDAKTTLEVTAAIGATAASGGAGMAAAAAGSGAAGVTLASAGVGGTYAATKEAGQQVTELEYGLRDEFDLSEVVEEGTESFVAGLVTGIVSGSLGKAFKKISRRLLRRVGYVDKINKQLKKEELKRINQSDLLSFLERQGVKFVENYGKEVLSATIEDVLDRLLNEERSLTPKKVLEETAKNFWDKKVIAKALFNQILPENPDEFPE